MNNINIFYALFILPCIVISGHGYGGDLFDRYSGEKTQEKDRNCSIVVKACTPHEGSRIDGTCNNYKRPSRGAARGPYLRLLKPNYGPLGELRTNRHGDSLPSARKVRTTIQTDGRVTDRKFNMAATHFLEFINDDVTAINGPLDYLRNRTYCCEEHKGSADPRCRPIHVPSDDPYLRMTGIHCMNYSRTETFQDRGCISKELDPAQINYQTPLLDLSTVYGVDDDALREIRLFEHGLLKETLRQARYGPLNETRDVCFQNSKPNPVCYKFGFPEVGNFDLTTTTITIFFYREHNRIARILHELNPCWKDDRLFKVARQINIATAANIFMYELLPELLGYKNMLNLNLISEHVDYVSEYNEDAEPLVFAEYEIARRFFHTFWDGRIKRYNEHYHNIGQFSVSDTLFKQELIEDKSNFEEINRGTFYQKAAQIDDIQDPDISEKFYSQSLQAHDRIAVDIQRGRDMGLEGYNSYRKICGQKTAKKFEDLSDVMSAEKIIALKNLYEDLEDVDLLVGIMSEELVPGLYVGPTLFCIMAKQLHVFRFSDRFWFERGKQYHSFTLPQLQEIRKTNMARFACDNAEGIKFIQPRALLNVGHGNEHVPCSHIGGPDLTYWTDSSCYKQYKKEYPGFTEEKHGVHHILPKFKVPNLDLHKYGYNEAKQLFLDKHESHHLPQTSGVDVQKFGYQGSEDSLEERHKIHHIPSKEEDSEVGSPKHKDE